MALHRWASGGSGGSSRVSAWILKPAAAAAAKISAMMIQAIGRRSSYPCPLGATYHYGNRAPPGRGGEALHSDSAGAAAPAASAALGGALRHGRGRFRLGAGR
jgi:hypothetical protein